jgi:TP901 family phage tail tape measure protein
MAVTDLAFKLFAIDEASPVFDRVAVKAEEAGAAAETAGKKHMGAAAAIGKFASVGSAAAILVGGASLKMAAEFQEGLTTLVTGAGESEKNLKMVGDGIKKLSASTGNSTKELTDGMYMIESAGYHGKAGLDVLAKAAQGAKVGNAQLGDVANGVTTLMTDYKEANINATQATNGLVSAVSQGKTHMQDLAVSLAAVAPIASTVHVSMSEMLGAMAELTSRGVPAAQASTMLKQTLINLKSPSKIAVTTLHDLGLKGTQVSNMLGKKGLAATFTFLNGVFKKNHVSSADAVTDLKNMVGGSKNLAGAMILSGKGLEGFQEKTKKITEATDKSKKGIEGWAEVQKDFNFKLDHFKASVQVAAISLGQQLLPIFTKLTDKISPFLPLIIKVVAALLAMAVVAKIVIMVAKFVDIMILFGKALRFAAIGMGILDGEMALNPFVAIAIAVIALGTAIYFVATKTQFFQTIWHAVWGAVSTAGKAVWSAIKVGLNGINIALRAVGSWATWLWVHGIKPVFDAIAIGAKIFAGVIGAVLVVPIYLLIKYVLAPVFTWLWNSVIKPTFNGIATIAKWLYANVVKPTVALIVTSVRAFGTAATWLYNNAISPAFHGIATVAKWLYANVIKPQLSAIVTTIKDLGKWGTWLYNNAISPAFRGIATVAKWLYNNGIKPVFAQMVNEVKTVGKWGQWLWTNALSPAFKLISRGASALKDAFIGAFKQMEKGIEVPVSFTINTVLGGMARTWNSIISKVGLKSLSLPVPHVGFATGGYVQGAGGPTDDKIPAMLSHGEYVIPAHVVKGNVGFFDSLVGKGQRMGASAPFNGGGANGIPGFSGLPNPIKAVVGAAKSVGGAIASAGKWVLGTLTRDVVGKVLEGPIKALISHIPGGGVVGDFLKAMVPKALSGLMDLFMKKNDAAVSSFGGGAGGRIPSGQHKAVIMAALAAAHVPPPGSLANWLTGMNTLITRESGWNAGAINRTDSNAKAGHPSQGLAQTIPGTFNAYVPASLRHLGILNPVANVAAAIRYIVSRYGNITNVQQAFGKTPKGYWAGGLTAPGWSMFGENGPELGYTSGGTRILSAQRTSKMLAGVGAGAGGHHGTVELIVKNESGKEIERKLVTLKSKRGGRKFDWER